MKNIWTWKEIQEKSKFDIMTGPHRKIAEFRKNRVRELTEKGLDTGQIGERLGMLRANVYALQVKHGFRKVENPRKVGDK